MSVGILAFGSLVENPGSELAPNIVRRIVGAETPFAVEFARSSRTRDGAPTLVPVSVGGAPLSATVLVLDDGIDEHAAAGLLYRRETWQIGAASRALDAGADWIRALPGFAGLEVCLYTALEANIQPLTASRLAELALQSASATAGEARRDGISYLAEQKSRGIETPLMPAYEAEVLARTTSDDLADAWRRARAKPST
jgi:hypothetical protein